MPNGLFCAKRDSGDAFPLPDAGHDKRYQRLTALMRSNSCMTQQLDEIFGELGISRYLDVFVDQGFDTWETILDITESDLDALGVKLGHRRKLQRRIANSRGVAPDAALVSPTRVSIEDSRYDSIRPEVPQVENRAAEAQSTVTAKRKYRRHPKTDENAPERPPSAYVLFSNKMREDLKGRNLTFTEIAKLVGENWQNLSQAEKEPFESSAQKAKDKYNQDLAEYKKTPLYKQYMVYLQDFKAKHSGSQQDKDVAKRVRLSDAGAVNGGQSVIRGAPVSQRTRGGTGGGSETPAGREGRLGSTASTTDSIYSASNPLNSGQQSSREDSASTPATHYIDASFDRSPSMSTSPHEASAPASGFRTASWIDGGQRAEASSSHRSLPPLSDVFDSRVPVNGAGVEANGYGFPAPQQSDSPGPVPSLVGGGSRPPSLRKEYSSTGSTSSSLSFPRTPIEGSLPIHALLSGGKPMGPSPHFDIAQPPPPHNKTRSLHYTPDRPSGEPSVNSILGNGTGLLASPPPISSHASNSPASLQANSLPPPCRPPPPPHQDRSAPAGNEASNLDGMSALLRAGEIVDRQNR